MVRLFLRSFPGILWSIWYILFVSANLLPLSLHAEGNGWPLSALSMWSSYHPPQRSSALFPGRTCVATGIPNGPRAESIIFTCGKSAVGLCYPNWKSPSSVMPSLEHDWASSSFRAWRNGYPAVAGFSSSPSAPRGEGFHPPAHFYANFFIYSTVKLYIILKSAMIYLSEPWVYQEKLFTTLFSYPQFSLYAL